MRRVRAGSRLRRSRQHVPNHEVVARSPSSASSAIVFARLCRHDAEPEPERRAAGRPPAPQRRAAPAAAPRRIDGKSYPDDRGRLRQPARSTRAGRQHGDVHRHLQQIRAVDAHDGRVRAVQRRTSRSCRRSRSPRTTSRTATGSTRTPPDKQHRRTTVNGTGPYKLKEWEKGDHVTFEANPNYWGTKAQGRDGRSSAGATEAAQRCSSSRPAPSTASTTSAPTTSRPIKADTDLQLYPREAPEHPVHRLQRTPRAVEQREGPPGDRHGHRPRADRQELLPGGLRGRDPLHPVRHPVRLRRRSRGTTSTPRRPRSC